MIFKPHLTIQDYFNKSGIGHRNPSKLRACQTSADRHQDVFERILQSAQCLPEPGKVSGDTGLTIQAYVTHPVKVAGHGRQNAVTSTRPQPVDPAVRAAVMPEKKDEHVKSDISRSIAKAAQKYNLSPELLHAMIKVESDYQVKAVSPAGAQGLMQLMPATARELGVANPFDIDQNIDGGAQYLRRMLDRFDGNVHLALAAYNAGPATVTRHENQIPPYPETKAYVRHILNRLNRLTT